MKEDYLSYARRILDYYDVDFPNRITQEFHFNAQQLGGWVGHLVNAYAQMYKITCDVKYANRARELLLYWSRYPAFNPPGEKTKLSVGPFIGCMLVGGLKILRDNGFVTREEEAPLWSCIYDMVNSLVDPYVKQGKEKVAERSHAWNHPTMDMTYAVETAQMFPDHPDAAKWMEWGRFVLDQSFNKPTVEDSSTGYTPLWFVSTIRAAELLGLNQGFYTYPYTRYYFEYIRDWITPSGLCADFGDGGWSGGWYRVMPILEKAATVYRDGTYKTAAHKLFRFTSQYRPNFGGETNFTPSEALLEWYRTCSKEMTASGGWYAQVAPDPREMYSPKQVTWSRAKQATMEASYLLLAYQWADDTVPEAPIPMRSALYERRAILRDSWTPEGSYLLFGLEDWTRVHGHGEGNAVNLLWHEGSILLHETSYSWRQSRHHNTVVFKEGISEDPFNYVWEPESPLFMLKVRPTERRARVPIFAPMRNAVFIRSRLDQFQRTLVKAGEAVYVFDYLDVKGAYTAACLWHTEKIIEHGGKHFRTRIENLVVNEIEGLAKAPGDGELLLIFPKAKKVGFEKEIRADTDEYAIFQLLSETFDNGVAFSSILFPVKRAQPCMHVVSGVEALNPVSGEHGSYPGADGVKLVLNGETVYVCCRNAANTGSVAYGDVESDADVLYVKAKPSGGEVAAVNVSTIRYKGETILSVKEKQTKYEAGF